LIPHKLARVEAAQGLPDFMVSRFSVMPRTHSDAHDAAGEKPSGLTAQRLFQAARKSVSVYSKCPTLAKIP
jgi:hypothetical protein